jgi:hypothetical protein
MREPTASRRSSLDTAFRHPEQKAKDLLFFRAAIQQPQKSDPKADPSSLRSSG